MFLSDGKNTGFLRNKVTTEQQTARTRGQVRWAAQCVLDAFRAQAFALDEAIASTERVHFGQISASQKFDVNGQMLLGCTEFVKDRSI